MRKLLSANFSRLWRSKIFWVLEILSAIAGAVFYILAIINEKNIGNGWFLDNGNYQREFNLPNPRYITGATRTIYTLADACIPASQSFNIARSEGEFNMLAIVCQLGGDCGAHCYRCHSV